MLPARVDHTGLDHGGLELAARTGIEDGALHIRQRHAGAVFQCRYFLVDEFLERIIRQRNRRTANRPTNSARDRLRVFMRTQTKGNFGPPQRRGVEVVHCFAQENQPHPELP